MVKAPNLTRLRQALSELAGQPSLSLKQVCDLAGVSPATAKRSTEFLDELRTAKKEAKAEPARRQLAGRVCDGELRGAMGEQHDKIRALRANVNYLVNALHAVNLVAADQAGEIQRLRGRRPGVGQK